MRRTTPVLFVKREHNSIHYEISGLEGKLVQAAQIVAGHRNGIGAMATVFKRLVAHGVEQRFLYPISAQARREADFAKQIANVFDRGGVIRIIQSKSDADAAINPRRAFGVEG